MQLKVKAGTPRHLDAGDNPTFERWMQRVDSLVILKCGLSVHDLPDCNYRDWYDDRVRPVYAAQRALRNAGDCD
jgi:hypothetical protein